MAGHGSRVTRWLACRANWVSASGRDRGRGRGHRRTGGLGTAGVTRATAGMAVAAMVLTILLTSCGGDGSVDLPAPTGSDCAALPRARRPSQARRARVGQSARRRRPRWSPSGRRPRPHPTSRTPATRATARACPPGSGGWSAALVAGVVGSVLVPRARRRRAWDAELTAAEKETRWLVREFLPQLQSAGTADEVAGGWQVGAGRVTLVEDQLTGMESAAPDLRAHVGPGSSGTR